MWTTQLSHETKLFYRKSPKIFFYRFTYLCVLSRNVMQVNWVNCSSCFVYYSVLTLFSTLSLLRSQYFLSLSVSVLLWRFPHALRFKPSLLCSRAFAKMSKVPSHLRYIFVTLWSKQKVTNHKKCISSPHFLFICVYCLDLPRRNYITTYIMKCIEFCVL